MRENKQINQEKFYKINEYLELKMQNSHTVIFVNGEKFLSCKRLLVSLEDDQLNSINEQCSSIDQLSEMVGEETTHEIDIEPKLEFWGHSSNLQAWFENDYDTRLLHSNLAFPLLKKLMEAGDPNAKRVFKDEIAERFLSFYPATINFLLEGNYLDYLSQEELSMLLRELEEHGVNLLDVVEEFNVITSSKHKELFYDHIRKGNLEKNTFSKYTTIFTGIRIIDFAVDSSGNNIYILGNPSGIESIEFQGRQWEIPKSQKENTKSVWLYCYNCETDRLKKMMELTVFSSKICLSYDDQFLACHSEASKFDIIDVKKEKIINSLNHIVSGYVEQMFFSNNGEFIVIRSQNQKKEKNLIYIINIQTNREHWRFDYEASFIPLSYDFRGNKFMITEIDSIKVFSINTMKIQYHVIPPFRLKKSIFYGPENSILLLTKSNKLFKFILDEDEVVPMEMILKPQEEIFSIYEVQKGLAVSVGNPFNLQEKLLIYDANKMRILSNLKITDNSGFVKRVAISRDKTSILFHIGYDKIILVKQTAQIIAMGSLP